MFWTRNVQKASTIAAMYVDSDLGLQGRVNITSFSCLDFFYSNSRGLIEYIEGWSDNMWSKKSLFSFWLTQLESSCISELSPFDWPDVQSGTLQVRFLWLKTHLIVNLPR